jgi:heme-degrading monooxygenase HmoA
MLARLVTGQGSTIRLDELIRRYREELAPRLLGMDGCQGATLLVDRAAGRVLAISLWTTEAAEQASSAAMAPIREEEAKQIGATQPLTVTVMETAVEDQTREPALLARVASFRIPPNRIDEAIGRFRGDSLASIQSMTGCKGTTLLVDRASGQFTTITRWATATAQQASHAALAPLREQFAKEMGATQQSTAEVFDIAVQAHATGQLPATTQTAQPPEAPGPHA